MYSIQTFQDGFCLSSSHYMSRDLSEKIHIFIRYLLA